MQPPESSIDIDIAAVAVATTVEVLVDITMPIVADGVGIAMAISISILIALIGESRGPCGLVEHNQDTQSSSQNVEGADQLHSILKKALLKDK